MVQKYLLALLPLLAANIGPTCRAFSPPPRPLASAFRKPSSSSSKSVRHLHVSTDQIDYGNNTVVRSSSPIRSTTQPSQRRIANVEKFARLPVWPVWQGVFLFFASKFFSPEVVADFEETIGGRVCPNFFEPTSTTPFVLLVHHRHGERMLLVHSRS